MDDLDRLMDQPADAPAASDPIDSAMDGYMQEQTGALRAGATLAIDSNPDEIARQKRIAKVLDVPVAAVEADPAFATRQQKLVEVEKATAQAPALRQKFTDADFAKLAHDDLDNLSGFEQLIRSAKRGWAAGLRGWDAGEIDAAARGLNALDQRNPANEPLRPGRNFTAADPATLSSISGQYSRLLGENAADFARRTWQLEANAATGATKRFYETQGWGEAVKALASDPFEITGNVVLESLGIMAPGTPAIVGGGLTGGPVGAGAAVGATSYSAEYGSAIAEEMQKSGVDLADVEAVKAFVATPEFAEVRRKASIKAAVIGAFDAATAGVAGVRLRPSATGNIAAQTGVQAAGGAAGEAAGSAASGQEINAASVLAEAIGEVPGALVDVTTQSGRNVIISRAKAEQAEADAKLVENLNQLATSSKVLQRDADTFEQFVAAAAEDGPVDTVYLDGRMLMQSGMAPRLAELSPAVRDQLDRAIITGGDIAIPVAEYAARIAPTDIAPQLIDHLKFDPEGFTRAEAADFMANEGDALQAEVERMLTDRQDADTFRASQDVVKQDILGQLNTAGRFTPQVNDAYATLASSYSAVRAAQLGMTPEAFHAERGMRVQGAAVAGQQFSQGVTLQQLRDDLVKSRSEFDAYDTEVRNGVEPDGDKYFGLADRVAEAESAFASDLESIPDESFALQAKTRDGRMLMLNPSAQKPGHYQLTRFGIDGAPWGDTQYPTKAQAIKDFLNESDASTVKDFAQQLNQPAPIQTDTPAFKAWFGDSKVVDADGKPLVVYHGSTRGGITNSTSQFSFFTSSRDVARTYSEDDYSGAKGESPVVQDVLLRINNPLEVDANGEEWMRVEFNGKRYTTDELAREAKRMGHDGLIVRNVIDNVSDEELPPADIFVTLGGRSQIKSATGNRGTFDPNDPNILHQSAADFLRSVGIQAGATPLQRSAYADDVQWTETGTDPATGFPTWKSRHVELSQPRDVTEGHDVFYRPVGNERAIRYSILNNDGETVGDLVLELESGWPTKILDIAVNEKDRGNKYAERTVAAIARDVGEIGVWHIVPDARAFWNRIGTSPIDEHDGVLSFDAYADARADRENAQGLAERRTDLATRARIDAMTPAEMRAAIEQLRTERRTSRLTGIPNIVAFEEDARLGWPAVAAADLDGLGFYNDVLGHELTDQILREVGKVLARHETDEVRFYHRSGDEFAARGTSQEAVDAAMAAAQAELSGLTVSLQLDGKPVTIAGLGISYGTADSYQAADQIAIGRKEARTAEGKRAPKGTNPGGITVDGQSLGERGEAKAQATERMRGAGVLYQSAQDVRDLVVTHNLSAKNLLHAVKMGGIPVPSLAVTTKDNPLTGFGEITLVGPVEMADPRGYAGTKVFGADIYSPRYPRVEYQFTPNMRKRVDGMFKDGANATDSSIDWEEVGRRGAEEMARAAPFMWQFLKNNGIEPKIVRTEVAPLPPAIQPFANDTRFVHELAADPAFIEAVYSYWTDQLAEAYDDRAAAEAEIAQDRARAAERGVDYFVRDWASKVNRYRMDSANAGTVDRSATRRMLEDQIREAGLNQEAETAAQVVFDEVGPNERIFQGFTNSGNRRYVAHTLENVVKILKKELRGGEGFNYGVGSIRSKFTPQFKSIKQIREAKGRLMDGAAFDKVKTEIDAEFVEVMESLRSYHASGKEFGFGDSVSSMMYDAATMGVPRAMRENGFDADVPVEVQQEVATFLGKLRTLPTEYFEAKILRDVDLAEFSAAVVPDDVKPEVIKALQDRGVKDIRTYKRGDEKDRAAKIGELEHLFFQPDGGRGPRGAFNPATNTVALLKNADLSTFLHETAHYFFESDIQLASELVGKPDLTPGEQQIVDDVSRLLDWHGVKGDVREQLRQWHTMDFEEQRAHHERTAESFEAYLFSGKAPSLELQPIFQRFRAWLVNVYKSLKDFLDRNPESGKLTDEVRGVFDRMIATQEQIALAEQGRSMLPLFGDPAKSGMTPDEFAAYQKQGVDATNEAIQALQAKGLRDMQWLANAKGREIRRLKRESRALRAEVEMEARREVMAQPLYRAWDFLTRKLGQEDKLPPLERKSDPGVLDPTLDSLFVAIAKLGGVRKDQVLSEWGVDPKDIPQSGLFGKPVWRITDGLTLDGMAEALAQHGYLPTNEHGQYELNDLGDRFLEELAGNPQYSYAHQPQDLQPGEQIANPGGLNAGRIDLAGLASIGVPVEVAAKLAELKMTAAEGLHPDLVAEMFGFTSGDELTRALAAAEKPKQAISQLADRMMLERHGELATPEAIERAADAAIHNEARARFVATEYNALAKATGQRRVLASAARDFAAQMVARLKIRDIRPQQYANAEVRAARASEKASKAGKVAEAAAEKRNQLINTYATRAAYDAQDEVETGVRYLRKFDKPSKSLDPDYQDQIDAMLERFELRRISNKAADRRASLAKWLEAQREAGMEPEIPPEIENEANRKPYREMTLEEFRGLVDTVKQIEHLGRLKHKLLTAQDQRAFGVIVDEVSASIVENGGDARPVQLETPTGIRPWLEGFAAGHRKLASLVRQMDGGKDNGPLWRVFVRAMNEAGTREAVINEQATVRLAEIYKPMLEKKGGLTGAKVFIPEINDSLTRGGRLAVALNWGNPTNRMRVMEGDNWSEAQVKAVLDTLTGDEWRFVQGVWNFIDSFWPEIEAKERRVTGRAPEKVQALPFTWTTKDGETVSLDGGYYPIKYDSNRDDRAEKIEAGELAKDMMRGAFTRSTTRRGHTKARVESVKRPVKKTLDVITQHVAEVTHDLAWHEWLIDANRLLDAKPINQAIREHYGTDVIRTMKDALSGIATADIVPQTKVDQALLYLRANVSRSTMGFSLTTAFLQPFGLSQSMVRIGTPHVLRGMARWAGDAARFESSMTWIREKSDFMRLRSKTFNRELHEIKGRVSKGHSKARTIYDASLFMLMQKMQLVADVPTWIGAYEKALAQWQDEASAVALADQAVLDSQGGGQTKDMAEFQRKHPFLTMFYSYFNTTLNLAAESTAATDFKNPLALAGWASDMAMLLVIPALAPAMLLALMRGDECDDVEECGKKLLEAQAGYLLNLMIGVREISGPVSGFDYAGPPAGRIVQELSRTGTQIAQGEADEALATSTISLLGVSLGIPTTQILRSYRGWKAWEDGEAPASSVLLGPPPKE